MAKDWKIELIGRHARLFHPPKENPEAAQGYPECSEGWCDLLKRACSRIEVSLGPRDSFRVLQIKEKFATLRFYWDGRFSETAKINIAEAIALAEARSACTCEICGGKGRLHNRGGWLATRCAEHAEGEPVATKPGLENVRIVRRVQAGRMRIICCRRYDRATDCFVDIEPRSLGIEE